MAVTAMKPKNAVESLRDIVQDLLVPELKALKAEITSIRSEMTMGFEAVRTEMTLSSDALRNEMTLGFEAVRTEMRLRDENQAQRTMHLAESLKLLSEKIDDAIEIRSRLAVLEDRLPRT